jgi:hypothetical protein
MPLLSEPFPFTAKLIAGAPEEPGVYALWLEGDIIYFGHAKGGTATIRSRLVDHFSGIAGPCTRRATQYGWEISLKPAEREAQVLADYQQQNHHLPLCNKVA